MQQLLKLVKPYRGRLAAVAVADALGMLMALLVPYVMSEIVDSGIAEGNREVLVTSSVLMLVLSLLSLGGNLVANKINTAVTSGYTRDVCRATFNKINALSYERYSEIGPSGLLTRATDDIFNIEGAISSLVYTAVTVPVMIIGSAVLALLADPTLAVVFMCSIPPVMLIIFFFMRPLYGMWDKSDKYVDEQNKIVRERLSGIRVVRAFNNDPREHGRAKHATEEMAKYMIRANVRGGYIEPCALFLLNLATVIMVAVAGGRAEAGLLDRAGDIIAVVQYVMILSGALINLSWTIAWLPRLRVSVKRISEIHASPREEEGHTECADPDGYSVSVEGVTFTYPSAKEPSLKNLSLEIKEGERVAIIGGTGSGKSTLVRLLIGLFRPSEGEIYLGGAAYSDMSRETLRAHYSTALQRGMIFEGTVRDNVAMGKPDAEDAEILEVLSDVQMREFVASHEEGLDYLLVGMGQNVSGGQKQRLGLARTVIRESDIYIFDDSFSALDYLTESRIRSRLEARLRGKTVITVTQRVSTALGASRIYVMDRGEIVAHGTHEELLRESDIYREICLSQIGEEALGGGACEK